MVYIFNKKDITESEIKVIMAMYIPLPCGFGFGSLGRTENHRNEIDNRQKLKYTRWRPLVYKKLNVASKLAPQDCLG